MTTATENKDVAIKEEREVKEISRKADIALANLSSGGLLTTEQSNTFLRSLIDQPTIIRDVRTVPMASPAMEINKIGFGSRILKPASQTAGSRELSSGDRSSPTTGRVTLNSKEVIAEVRLPYEVLEDNIERGNMESTILTLIAERAALDLEELIIKGDTGSGDSYLALMNGVLALSTTNTVNAAGAGISANIFNSMLKALPSRYRRNRSALRFYTPHDVEQDYRLALSSRGTGLGDAILTGNAPVPVFGVPLSGVATISSTNGLLLDPNNIVFGVQRNVRIETDKDIRTREVIIVLTARVAVALEEELAVVKLTNLG